MLRMPPHALFKMFIAIALAMIAASFLWVYFIYSLGMEAMEGGPPLSSGRVAVRAAVPVFIALLYCAWALLRHAAGLQEAIRAWLRDGRLFRWDNQKRCLSTFNWLVRPHDHSPRKWSSHWAKRYEYRVWVWGAKPALIGLLAVLASSPVLLVSPIIGEVVNLDITSNGVLVVAATVWIAATAAYLAARKTGYLDENDRTPAKRAALRMKKARMAEQCSEETESQPSMSVADTARQLLSNASAHFQARQDEDALLFYRQALRTALGAFQHSQEGELLHLSLLAYRGIAVAALATGRNHEAATAIETGLASAEVGLRQWPDAPPLVEEKSALSTLKAKTGLTGWVYIPDDFSRWISDD